MTFSVGRAAAAYLLAQLQCASCRAEFSGPCARCRKLCPILWLQRPALCTLSASVCVVRGRSGCTCVF